MSPGCTMTERRRWRLYVTRGVMHIEIPELPDSLDNMAETVGVLAQHPGLEGFRVLIDCTEVPPVQEPPSVPYIERLADVLYPLTIVADRIKCALVVRGQAFTWRARYLASRLSGPAMEWRVFGDRSNALVWLGAGDGPTHPIDRRGGEHETP